MTKPATHPTQVFVNGRAFAWTPETGLDPAAVSALDDYLWREANRTARAFRRLGRGSGLCGGRLRRFAATGAEQQCHNHH